MTIDDLDRKTQAGFKDVRTEMHDEFKKVKAEMDAGLKDVRAEMHAGFQQAAADLQAGLRDVRAEMHDGFEKAAADLEAGLQDVRTEIRAEIKSEGAITRRHFDLVAEQFKEYTRLLADGTARNTERLDDHEKRITAIEGER
jgi:hypothetical protein